MTIARQAWQPWCVQQLLTYAVIFYLSYATSTYYVDCLPATVWYLSCSRQDRSSRFHDYDFQPCRCLLAFSVITYSTQRTSVLAFSILALSTVENSNVVNSYLGFRTCVFHPPVLTFSALAFSVAPVQVWCQWTTYRKLRTVDLTVTWPLTSRDPKRWHYNPVVKFVQLLTNNGSTF